MLDIGVRSFVTGKLFFQSQDLLPTVDLARYKCKQVFICNLMAPILCISRNSTSGGY